MVILASIKVKTNTCVREDHLVHGVQLSLNQWSKMVYTLRMGGMYLFDLIPVLIQDCHIYI